MCETKGTLIMEHANAESIEAALKLLEDAATQGNEDLRTAMSDKYTNLRSLIMEKESDLMKSLAIAKESALEAAANVKEASVAKAREIASKVDKSVHENPWPYIGGSLAAGVLLGFLLGRSGK